MESNSERTQRRESNDLRRRVFGITYPLIEFVCECDSDACYRTVALTPAAFDALRAKGLPVEAHGVLAQ